MKSRREFLKMAGIGTTASLFISYCRAVERISAGRPNILFIMSDDHAAHAISAYGSKINSTPNIDRIAREGMRFDRCFCTNSICAPSRAVILTGNYSHLNGVINNAVEFDGSQQTLPKLLQKAGYSTAIVGKWHLASAPTGFDYSNILPGQGSYHNPLMIENDERCPQKGYVTDLITDHALAWLKKQESSGKPFFLMLHHKAPHANWESDQKHESMCEDKDIPLPETFNDDYATRSAQVRNSRLKVDAQLWNRHFMRFGKIPGGMIEQETREWVYQKYMKNYLRCIASVDDNVGRVLDYLDASGLAENTIVVYTSDQGFFLGDHGLYDKRLMYEDSLRMPFLMRYPGEISSSSVSEALVLNLDFAPTFLDFAQADIAEDMQGVSFRKITQGHRPADWREAVYYRFYEKAFGIGPHEGIRTERYKLIHYLYGDEGRELYDLKQDPSELNNLYGNQAYTGLAEGLEAQLAVLRVKYKVTE